ncbi:FtsW/RodA/SpoVE family cell cycle protein [Canibacter zhoujuaniae]|uniref:FtsW/RodA/SpoVE family cell cycle protein n=1 Tax=Canibacter zhoujuaniae TaxID=2708343 RepID=UPI0014242450|nr:FtsW/RodA/SpoVE family cell cycle protein [Canibacter zhoujuaniae]
MTTETAQRDFASATRSENVLQRLTAIRAPRKLRALEFVLLLAVIAIGIGAIVIVDLTVKETLSTALLIPGAAYIAILFGLHLVVRRITPDADPLIMPLAAILNILGIVMIYRIEISGEVRDLPGAAARQILWSIIAMVATGALVWLLKNHRTLLRYTYIFGLVGVLLLVLPLVPGIGHAAGGAQQWIRIGSFSFQPVELAKIALAIFFASYLVRNRDALSLVGRKIGPVRLPRARDLGPLLIVWLIAMGILIFQRELGTSVLVFGLFLAVLYVATGRIGWVLIGLSLFLVGGFIAAQTFSYVGARFNNWLHPFRDPQGASYQLVQGFFGMANGGITGTGLGAGYPQITPLSYSDYIFPSVAEELGLVGAFMILTTYLILVARGMRISFAVQDDFGKLLALALAFTITLQVFVIVGGVTGIIPLTGLTTPFLAAGGSSLLSNWLIVGLLLLMSNAIRNRPKLVIRA